MKLIIVLILLISNSTFALNKSRKIQTNNDEVSEVKTALGIATKIILPESPTMPPIIGDIGAFRIESIDKGYAVKPLRSGAKTNLFISTDSRSYSVKLIIVSQDSADYIVYLTSKENIDRSQISWRDFKRKIKSSDLRIETKRVGKTKDGFIVLEFTIFSNSKNYIDPEWFYISQGRDSKQIHSLIFSSREVDSDKPVSAALTIDKRNLSSELPATFELKYRDGIKLEINREFLWRK